MKTTPKDFFLWVGAMASLLASTIALLALWFEYIDRAIGSVEYYNYGYSSGIITALSVLMVIFPLYILFTRLLHRDIRLFPEKKELWVRKWLVYTALAAASLTLVVDLIVLIQSFLGGEELTVSFLLKVFSVFVVVGSILLYYMQEIKNYWDTREAVSIRVGALVCVVVVLSISLAFFIIGSPRTQRLMRYDQQKVSDLQAIQSQITTFYQQKNRLPENMAELNDPLSYFVVPVDPQVDGDMAYEYKILDAKKLSFSLCATFNTASESSSVDTRPLGFDAEYWKYAKGKTCFERTIDPEKYPLFEKKSPAQSL